MSIFKGVNTGTNFNQTAVAATTSVTPQLVFPIVNNIELRMDDQNRINLNDIHRASGENRSKEPSQWLANKKTKELVAAYSAGNSQHPLQVIENVGTWAIEELATEYMGWLSVAFKVQCLRILKDFNHGKIQQQVPEVTKEQLELQLSLAQQTNDPIVVSYLQGKLNAIEVQEVKATQTSLVQDVNEVKQEVKKLFSKVEREDHPQEDPVPENMLSIGDMYRQLRKFMLSRPTIEAILAANKEAIQYKLYRVRRNGFLCEVEHYLDTEVDILMYQFMLDAKHQKGTKYTHSHPWVASFRMLPLEQPF